MKKRITLSRIERIYLSMSINVHIDRLTNLMYDLHPEIPLEKALLDKFEEMRLSLYKIQERLDQTGTRIMIKLHLTNIEQIELISALNHYINFCIESNHFSLDLYNGRLYDLVSLKEKIQNA